MASAAGPGSKLTEAFAVSVTIYGHRKAIVPPAPCLVSRKRPPKGATTKHGVDGMQAL